MYHANIKHDSKSPMLDSAAGVSGDLMLGDLPGFTTAFNESTPGEIVDAYFKTNSELPGVLVVNGKELVGLMTRSTFFQLLSQRHGVAVYYQRPLSLMLEHAKVETLLLPDKFPVREAIDLCLKRPQKYIYEPLVVSSESGYKIVNFHELIVAQSRLLNKTMLQIERQQLLLREKNKEILDSIQYAERIQKSMLQNHANLDRKFLQLFFLFRPRDIVSGDFFWIAEHKDKIFLAAVDCTGHGVPGAFLSLIGHNFLDDIVISRGITAPNLILSNLHESIRRSLNQSNDAKSGRDGMDVCLCVVDTKTAKLSFSGAKRPLYYTGPTGELVVCKGDRFSIGGLQREEARKFNTREIDLCPGLTFFLTTDGFADQSSEDKHKFGSLRLKGLLREIHALPLVEKQRQLESALDNHQHNQPQRDDITVVGMEWCGL